MTGAADRPWAHEEGDGDGPLVVLVHGTMDRSTSFVKAIRRLDGLRVVRYDRRGYGRSAHLPVADHLDDHVDDLFGVVAGRPAVVAGHSIGGVIALVAAERRPDLVRAVAVYEAPMSWAPWWPRRTVGAGAAAAATGDPAAAAELFMRRMVGDERWERLPARTREERRAEGRALLSDLTMVRRAGGPPYDGAALAVPLVVGHGAESAPHHAEAARRLAAAVPGARLVCVDGAGHGAHTTHPDDFAGLVREAVARAG